MTDTAEILAAFDSLCGAGKPSALATVISVYGSAYRRPGARMLIAEDGHLWGGISGGCLERDVGRRGRGVIDTQRPVICLYDTRDDEPAAGPATGCRGAIEIFIQPLSSQCAGPLPYLRQATTDRREVSIATVVRAPQESGVAVGALLTLHDVSDTSGSSASLLNALSNAVPTTDVCSCKHVRMSMSGAVVDLLIERIIPPQSLIIFGDGPDSGCLMSIAQTLGWHVMIVAARPASYTFERFRNADSILIPPADDPGAGVPIDDRSAIILMTHNYPRDRAILQSLRTQPRYLGILGPRDRAHRLLAEVGDGILSIHEVHAPVGLDLGAETPQEIALAIVAEIQAVSRGASAGFLRDRPGRIHRRPKTFTPANDFSGPAFAERAS